MVVIDLGQLDYRAAWKLQEEIHHNVAGGAEEQLLLVEHPPVITFGRRPGISANLIATKDQLEARHVEVIESDRGGDITFHGPGQLVVYPILRLSDYRLSISGYVHQLEKILIAALAKFNVEAHADPAAIGVWVSPNPQSAIQNPQSKIAAIGVRLRRGVTMHGLALNVTTDLSYFDLIVPCGLAGRKVTSLQRVLGPKAPTMAQVKTVLVRQFHDAFPTRPS